MANKSESWLTMAMLDRTDLVLPEINVRDRSRKARRRKTEREEGEEGEEGEGEKERYILKCLGHQ
jgi:hypothetical protein